MLSLPLPLILKLVAVLLLTHKPKPQPDENAATQAEVVNIKAATVQEGNIGILTGEPSGWLIDIDLDCPEAVAAARLLLPPTGFVYGRPSNPDSHWLYISEGMANYRFADSEDEQEGEEDNDR